MDRQTLRDWVIRYNDQGIAGLSDLPKRGGAAPKLSAEERAVLTEWVQRGPDLAEDGVVRWRLRDLRERILARFFVLMDERSVGRILKSLTFSHISVRPRHPQADAEAQEAHKKRMARPVGKRFPRVGRCSLRQRIRPVSSAPAKMEIRASWSS
jgi:transposase